MATNGRFLIWGMGRFFLLGPARELVGVTMLFERLGAWRKSCARLYRHRRTAIDFSYGQNLPGRGVILPIRRYIDVLTP